MRITPGLRWLALAILLVFGLSIWWGVTQFRLHRQFAVRLENNYQRAFHELVWHVQTIENELAKLSVASTAEQEMEKLATVWRQLYAAQEKVGQLPLGLVSLENAEKYLATVGDQVFALVRRGTGLSANERTQIDNMQQGAAQLAKELAELQQTVLTHNLRWTDVESALIKARTEDEVRDNSVINSFSLVNKQVQEYPEVQFDQRIGILPPTPRLEGNKVSREEAAATALWFIDPGKESEYRIVSSELTGGPIPTYNFLITGAQDETRRLNVAVTETRGRVLWMLDSRQPATAGNLPAEALQEQAANFLRRRGYNNMRLVGQHEYQGSMHFAYVFEQDGVLIYPDLLRVRVAADDGRVIGFEGNGYTVWHKERELPSPKISMQEALEGLAQGLELIGPAQLAVIFNAQSEETLVYEFPVERSNDRFLVYVDAQTGKEVQIVRLESTRLPKKAS
ncbi:MAG: germination protein YpeB [Firmicutes bacterium]|nr:germination protein YpeB [Bacillota bacterium]